MAWGIILNGVGIGSCPSTLGCSSDPVVEYGFLNAIPDGLSPTDLRTETVTYAQRDGARFFSDWRTNRVLTFQATVCPDVCPTCPSAREQVAAILRAWDRSCGDTELVLFTDCSPDAAASDGDLYGEDTYGLMPLYGGGTALVTRALTGPYGVIGRPRAVEVTWDPSGCASLVLRFDAIDHKFYVLDDCGNPGSGELCYLLSPGIPAKNVACVPFCITDDQWCIDTPVAGVPGVGATVTAEGSECACATITLTGPLLDPVVQVTETGQSIGYVGNIGALDAPVIIDGATGTAVQGGQDVTYKLTGDTGFCIPTTAVNLVLTSQGVDDTGTAEVCVRTAMGWA